MIDYPTTNPWDRIHVVYDGVNGQLPNLDLFNTAVHISGHQMGVQASLQEMFGHSDSYEDRLRTMLRGMVNQGLGHATGPHSSFISYHIDAITLQVSGEGYHDEVTMGRILESLFRSLNNLLEKFHQSFFFYLLLGPKRFVSIGTYLPSAMLIAVNFTITAIGLWIKSGRRSTETTATEKVANEAAGGKPADKEATEKAYSADKVTTKETTKEAAVKAREENITNEAMEKAVKEAIEEDITKPWEKEEIPEAMESETKKAVDNTATFEPPTRPLLLPISLILLLHLLGFIPLYIFNNLPTTHLSLVFTIFLIFSLLFPFLLSSLLHSLFAPTKTDYALIKCFSLLSLGLYLSALATLNFSLSFLIGLFSTPFTFVGPQRRGRRWLAVVMAIVLQLLAPTSALLGVAVYWGEDLARILAEAAFGWRVWGMWTQVVVWCVWWPAWIVAGVLVAGSWWGMGDDEEEVKTVKA